MQNHPLAESNVAYLQQALDLLETIDNDLYAKPVPPAFNSGVGSHLRHTLDHVQAFVDGWMSGKVDYDHRDRETPVEQDLRQACLLIQVLIVEMRKVGINDGARVLKVKMDGGAAEENVTWSQSTVNRELQFLVSHTVHHYALIAALLRTEGHDPGEAFGVAPSTLKYRQQLQCAP